MTSWRKCDGTPLAFWRGSVAPLRRPPMTRRRPPLHKRRLFTHGDYTVFAVDPLAVRDMSQGDEEFGNFAVHDEFPRTIPKNEIWITDRIADEEGIFFIANAVA